MTKSLRYLKGQLTRAEAKAKNANTFNVYSLKHFVDELEKDYGEIKAHFDSRELTEAEEQEYWEIQDKYEVAHSTFKETIDTKLRRDPNESFNQSAPDPTLTVLLEKQGELFETVTNLTKRLPLSSECRLPPLKLPQFSGDYKSWNTFKNLFVSRVGNNENLTDVEKLGHLLTLVTGEAAGLIRHLQLAGTNYQPAWDALERKYGKPYKIATDIIKKFRGAMRPEIRRHNLSSFDNTFAETFLALDNLSGYSQGRDIWIIHDIVDHFDKSLKEKWASHIVGNSEPSLDDMSEFLTEQSEIYMDRDFKAESIGKEKFVSFRKDNVVKGNAVSFTGKCFVCGSDHYIFNCEKFGALSASERDKLIKSSNRCFNCLGSGHSVKRCKSSRCCTHCGKRHHSLLHNNTGKKESPSIPDTSDKVNDYQKDPKSTLVSGATGAAICPALRPTAVVDIVMKNGAKVSCRLMLDTGAQASFVTSSFARKLNLTAEKEKIPIQVMSRRDPVYSKGRVKMILASRYKPDVRFPIVAHVCERLTDDLPGSNLVLRSGRMLHEKFSLADPRFDISAGIDLIVGAEHFFYVLGRGKYHEPSDNLYVIESLFGWLVSGGHNEPTITKVQSAHSSFTPESDDRMIKRFWDLDDVVSERMIDEDVQKCEMDYAAKTVRDLSGRYSVSLPFKSREIELGESYELAMRRFHSLERRLERDPSLKRAYVDLMDLFMLEGYLEPVPPDRLSLPSSEHYYLPHYAVVSKKSEPSMKIRIVFDASMMTDNGTSLNDVLLTGPNLQPNLLHLINRFSISEFVFSADITKMYRQIKINVSCRDFQRILWRKNRDNLLNHYRLTTVVDGMSCSPYLALRTLQQLIVDEKQTSPLGAEAMKERYMDDFFVGDSDLNKLFEKKRQLIQILKSAGMSLSKWASNVPGLANELTGRSEVAFKESSTVKTLGVLWDTETDCFSFNLAPRLDYVLTTRSLLSESARIFDPAGWIAPVTVSIKMLFQSTWIRHIAWDDPLPDDLKSSWIRILEELPLLNNVRLPRWIGHADKIYLHGFCDASLHAYGAVVFIKVVSSDGCIKMRLLSSKSKVAPLKPMSIARLELCGANLLTKLLVSVLPTYHEFDTAVRCWCDSTTVLAWLASKPSRWATFVSNRCGQIHDSLPNVPWNYVKSERNMADVISRGMLPSELINYNDWWRGPRWLHELDEEISIMAPCLNTREEQRCMVGSNAATCVSFIETFISRFSSLNRLRRTFAYVRRMVTRRGDRMTGDLSLCEVEDAFKILLKSWQNEHFAKEIDSLRSGRSIATSSRIVRLSPFIDDKGLLRVGGRLENSNFTFGQRHPILLANGHLIRLIVDFLHVKYFHASFRFLIPIFRSQFYCSGLRSAIKKCLRTCQRCVRLEAKTYLPIMGQLPAFRFESQKPFLSSGIDFAGPISVRPYLGRGRITIKAYICVLICLATKAVHVELVLGLDTGSLVLALKRFVSRRGACSTLYSDNGTNFVGCARHIRELKHRIATLIESEEIRKYLSDNLMRWQFMPPQSPTFGGIWEAGVKSIKYHLNRVLFDRVPTVDELTTFLCEIECLLNSRPIAPMNNDPDDFEFITPSHLLTGHPSVHVPLCGVESSNLGNVGIASRFSSLRRAMNSFWRSWRNEFCAGQLKMEKWFRKGLEPAVGDLVLIR